MMEDLTWGRINASPSRHNRQNGPPMGGGGGPPSQGGARESRSGSFGNSYFGSQQPQQQPQPQPHPFAPHHLTHMPQQLFIYHDDERMALINHHQQQQQQQQQQQHHHHHPHHQPPPQHMPQHMQQPQQQHLSTPHHPAHHQQDHSPQRHSMHHSGDYGSPFFQHKDLARRSPMEGEKLVVARMGLAAKSAALSSSHGGHGHGHGLGVEEMGDMLDRGEDTSRIGGFAMHNLRAGHGGGLGGGGGGGDDMDGEDGGLKQEYSVLLERGDDDDEEEAEDYFLQGGGVIYYDDLVEGGGASGIPEEDFPFDDESSTTGNWTGLDMGRVGLSVIGPEITFYPNLTSLYLNNNKFTEIPESIFQLTRLVRLDLSFNAIQRIPPEIGRLIRLEELSLFRNKIRELPVEFGRLYRLKLLQLDGNPVTNPPFALIKQGAEAVVLHLRDRMPLPPAPPQRLWLDMPRRMGAELDDEEALRIKVLCYNILAEKYAIPELLSYCPSQYLKWTHRRTKILEEIQTYDCDFLALQEVEAGHYKQFFEPEMAKMGYAGVFKPKSRARTMGDWNTVDGCVLFYKPDKYELLDEFWIEYQSSSIKRYEKEFPSSAQALDRLISKDQIAVAAVFRCKNAGKGKSNGQDTNKTSESDGQSSSNGTGGSSKVVGNHLDGTKKAMLREDDKDEDPLLMIVNTHIHWDPAFPDVKLMQVCMLLEELETITTPLTPPEAAVVAKYGIADQPVYVDTFASGLSNETAKKIMTKRYPGVPMLICGDFNSMPDSGVYEYVRKGQISGSHSDFGGYDYGRYTRSGPQHPFNLASAYEEIGEPSFTNYTDGFVGCLDYMFYTRDKFEVLRLLQPVDESTVFDQTGALPNAYMCSDHICLASEFKMKKLTKKDREREIRERERERAERNQRIARSVGPIGGGGGGGGSGDGGMLGGPASGLGGGGLGSGFFYRERSNGQPKRDF